MLARSFQQNGSLGRNRPSRHATASVLKAARAGLAGFSWGLSTDSIVICSCQSLPLPSRWGLRPSDGLRFNAVF
jgi:hypothetical protein